MKIMISLFFVLVSSVSFAGETLTVGVNGMVCAFCAQGIEKQFKSQVEVEAVQVDLTKKYVKLTFKDGKSLSKDKIGTILKDAGYEARFED